MGIDQAAVLLSHLAIPSSWHGSYNVMFTRFLRESDCFDYTISPVTLEAVDNPGQYKTNLIGASLVDKKRRFFFVGTSSGCFTMQSFDF